MMGSPHEGMKHGVRKNRKKCKLLLHLIGINYNI